MKRIAIVFLRPLYRVFFEKPLWWFLSKVKAFYFAEVGVQLGDIQKHLADSAAPARLLAIERRLAQIERAETEKWNAIEELLLALFRQPVSLDVQERSESLGSDSEDDFVLSHAPKNANPDHAANNSL